MIITVWHVGVRFCIWSAVISEFLSVKLSDNTMPLWHLKRLMAQIKASALCHIISAHHTQHVAVTHLQEYAKLLHNSYWTKIKFRSLTRILCFVIFINPLFTGISVSSSCQRDITISNQRFTHSRHALVGGGRRRKWRRRGRGVPGFPALTLWVSDSDHFNQSEDMHDKTDKGL